MSEYFLKLERILNSVFYLFLTTIFCQQTAIAQESITHEPNAHEPIVAITNNLQILKTDPKIVALGEQLFNDPRISRSDSLACSSCHPIGKSTMDGIAFSYDKHGKPLSLNTPSLNYVVLNHYFTWTGRFPSLEAHLSALIQNTNIFNQSWPDLIAKLKNNGYIPQFQKAGLETISQKTISQALITFQRSLAVPSRFDYYLVGDKSQLSKDEIEGYKLFKDYGCIACHQGINIGGNLRQKFGVMKDYFSIEGKTKKSNFGFYNTSQLEADQFTFRVPSLRNVSLTAPYFHDASAETLEEAIKVMAKYQLGVSIPANEIQLLKSFLGSLVGIPVEASATEANSMDTLSEESSHAE